MAGLDPAIHDDGRRWKLYVRLRWPKCLMDRRTNVQPEDIAMTPVYVAAVGENSRVPQD
jgi:hypothetical protein